MRVRMNGICGRGAVCRVGLERTLPPCPCMCVDPPCVNAEQHHRGCVVRVCLRVRCLTPPDSILVLPRIFLAPTPLPARSPLPPCEPARRNVEPPMVRPAPQPPCAHPSTRRRLRPASHCLPAAPFLWAAGGGVQRPQARCPRARTGSTSRTTTCRSPACRSPSSATPTRTPRPGPSSTTRATASSAPAAWTASAAPNPRAHCGKG